MTDTVRALNQSTFGNTWIGGDWFVVLSLLFPFYRYLSSSPHIFQLFVQVHQTDGLTVGRSLLLFVVTRRSRAAPNEMVDTTAKLESITNQHHDHLKTISLLPHACTEQSNLFRFSSNECNHADNDITCCCC